MLNRPSIKSKKAIANRLRLLRVSQLSEGQERVPLATFADFVGCHVTRLYQLIESNGSGMTELLQRRLSSALEKIDSGELYFTRTGQQWTPQFRDPRQLAPLRQLSVSFSTGRPSLHCFAGKSNQEQVNFLNSFDLITGRLREAKG